MKNRGDGDAVHAGQPRGGLSGGVEVVCGEEGERIIRHAVKHRSNLNQTEIIEVIVSVSNVQHIANLIKGSVTDAIQLWKAVQQKCGNSCLATHAIATAIETLQRRQPDAPITVDRVAEEIALAQRQTATPAARTQQVGDKGQPTQKLAGQEPPTGQAIKQPSHMAHTAQPAVVSKGRVNQIEERHPTLEVAPQKPSEEPVAHTVRHRADERAQDQAEISATRNSGLTGEQEAVVAHPMGHHARVLAVAGSGKTTTLVHRIKHLTMDLGVAPRRIRVLMFNRLARQQFEERMVKVGIPAHFQPAIHTFHSFAYHFIKDMMDQGILPGNLDFWLDNKVEQVRLTVHRAITELERNSAIEPDAVDPDEALQAIQLWKGSLIPPERAGYKGSSEMPLVYAEFEQLRTDQHALTFDDFVPVTVSILESNAMVRDQYCGQTAHLIIDEYQDVNFGQQRLIELLAGRKADVTVVGDDDQTIHEWRGARPSYLVREFRTVFDNKPHVDYTLSRSFRFGPVIAQCAHNVISFNTTRVKKALVAHYATLAANLNVVEPADKPGANSNADLTLEVIELVRTRHIHPTNIIVLCRMFAQLGGLQAEFLARGVPFRVVGQAPFFERQEIRVLLEYIRLSKNLTQPMDRQEARWLVDVINKPQRYIRRTEVEQAANTAQLRRLSANQLLQAMVNDPNTPLNRSQKERVTDLLGALREAGRRIGSEPQLLAADLLRWLIDRVDYLSHFDEYYGEGEESFDRQQSITNFIDFAKSTKLPTNQFLQFVENLDTTHGVPEDQQIVMTSVFRAKGLEYDYVFIPDCTEGFMPYLNETGNRTFDVRGIVEEPEASETIENERRLYYVAITRARQAVYLGTSQAVQSGNSLWTPSNLPSRFLDETQIEPTVQVMTALQRHAAGLDNSRADLIKSVERHAGNKRILQNLLSRYPSELRDDGLLSTLVGIITRAKEQPFSYRQAYQRGRGGRQDEQTTQKLHDVWGRARS